LALANTHSEWEAIGRLWRLSTHRESSLTGNAFTVTYAGAFLKVFQGLRIPVYRDNLIAIANEAVDNLGPNPTRSSSYNHDTTVIHSSASRANHNALDVLSSALEPCASAI
jgi:hypothetical protein